MTNVWDKNCRENQNTHFVFSYFFRQSCCLWDNVKNNVKPDRPQMTIWRMRVACWIPKSSHTRSEYVILINFTQQQWLRESTLVLRLCIHCLCCHSFANSQPSQYCRPLTFHWAHDVKQYIHLCRSSHSWHWNRFCIFCVMSQKQNIFTPVFTYASSIVVLC